MGQGDERFQAAGTLIVESNVSAMTADDGLRSRQTQADTSGSPIARSVDPEKWRKDPRQRIRGDSGPAIPDRNGDGGVPGAEFDLRGRGVFHGILDQVGKGPLQSEWAAAIDRMHGPRVTNCDTLVGVIVGYSL